MGISSVINTLNSNNVLLASASVETKRSDKADSRGEVRHEHSHGHKRHGRGKALGIFRQEMRASIKLHFYARFTSTNTAYAKSQDSAAPGDIADEALGAAKQVVAESPSTAAKSLISFRARVHESASIARQTVGSQVDTKDLDATVAKVDQGLTELEARVANEKVSSASVLEVNTRTKQRSTIKIRTQEGDVVKLMLRRVDKMSASDIAQSSGNNFSSLTEVEVSSRSRMILKVDGDLNEAEFAAIQDVFMQAEKIANEFFGGDLAAAFDLAQGFEFDTEQLARVKMRFRFTEMTRVSYTESVQTAPPSATIEPAVDSARIGSAAPVQAVAETETDEAAPQPVATPDMSDLSGLFETLSTFLRSIGEGFTAESGTVSFKMHYSESFKLELLKAVMHTTAPDDSADEAAAVATVIDAVVNEADATELQS